MKTFLIFALLAATASFQANAKTGGASTVGPANPYVVCQDLVGGKLDDVSMICSLGEAEISVWSLHANMIGNETLAVKAYKTPETPANKGWDPELDYCRQMGGEPVITTSHRMCHFNDDSQIGLLTLYWGPSNSLNSDLNKALEFRLY